MFWKIYSWFLAVMLVAGHFSSLTENLTVVRVIDVPISLVGLLGLFACSYKKKILDKRFWRIFLVLLIGWDILCEFLKENISFTSIEDIVILVIAYLITLPEYIAIYKYAFTQRIQWDKPQPSNEEVEFVANEDEGPHIAHTVIPEGCKAVQESPTILRRYLSTFIDGIFILLVFVAVSLTITTDSAIGNYVRVSVFFIMFFFYEPIFTCRFCTIGQKITGIRVRTYGGYQKISIPAAYLRVFIKILLGLISLLSIPLTKDRRAIHDFASGSIVIMAT